MLGLGLAITSQIAPHFWVAFGPCLVPYACIVQSYFHVEGGGRQIAGESSNRGSQSSVAPQTASHQPVS